MNKFSTISVIIPTYNEEKNIDRCLKSIFQQGYPKSKLEVIIVDDGSSDQTLQYAKKYPVKIIKHNNRHGEIGKMIGFRKAIGEFAMYLDADIELRGKNWFRKMLKPLLEEKDIIGSYTRYYSKEDSPAIERYLNFDPLQRDSIYQFFSPSIDDSIIKRTKSYFVCKYNIDKIPPAGLCLYRRTKLLSLVKEYDMFLELDFLVILVKNGYDKFAYVPKAGLYHHHVASLGELLKKRSYNVRKVYLRTFSKKLYKWFDLKNPKDFVKICLWVIYANMFFPAILVGVYKSKKHKDLAGMYEPFVNLLATDTILASYFTDKRSWKLFKP